MCWDPNTYEVNSCPYCYSSYEKTVIKNKKHDNEKNYQSDCAVKKVKVYDGSVNEDSIDNIYDNDPNFESDFESEKIWSIVNIDNWSKEKKKHDNEKNYQSDSVTKKVKVHDRGVNENSIDNIYDNDLNSESDSESDSDIGQFFVFQSIDEIEKQKAVDRLLKASKEAEEFCQDVNEIEDYDNELNEINVKD